MISKKVGGTDASGAAALQFVDYKYNVRGWLTDINNIMNLAQQGGGPQDLFAFRINYNQVDDDINGAVEPLYNGNIAETFWKTSSDNIIRKYGYAYDFQDRLLDAYYQKPTGSVPLTDSYSAHYSYDSNGNLLSLQRNGGLDGDTGAVGIDDLDYAYDGGNRLMRVQDYEFSPAGYHDLHTSPTQDDFDYDTYGNLVLDRDKGITHIGYNHLNLPIEILFSGGGKIEYLYDATGIKLKKKVTDGTTITTTEYLDGFQYTNTVLDFFPHAEGYVKAVPTGGGSPGGPSGVAYKYVFSFTDHLGNIRLKYAQDPSNNNEVSILEEDHYYPYGLKHLGYNTAHKIFKGIEGPGTGITLTPVNPFLGDSYKYKFGGKEYQEEFDINTYDFGARNYDPALGRWMNIDPLAERMRRHSPYNYAFNNPVFFIDPDGMVAIPSGSGLLVSDTNFLGTSDIMNGNMGSASIGNSFGGGNTGGGSGSSSGSSNNPGAYKAKFQQMRNDLAKTDYSLSGGDPIDPPKYNGTSVAVGAINELPEVVISGKSGGNGPGASGANWFAGTVAEGVRSNSNFYSKNYTAKYGTGISSASEITKTTRSSMATTARWAGGIGYGTSAVGIGLSAIEFGMSDKSWGDYGRLGVSVTATALTLSGYTAPIGIGMSFADMAGGFNGFYNHLDNQQQLYNTSGGIMAPLGPTGLPVFVPLK